MHARHILSVVSAFSLPLLFAPLAHAQAPGEVAVQPVVMVPESACVACGCNRGETVMSRRWAVGLSLGSMSLAPDGRPDEKTAFAIGELALRFRATRHFELELAAGGGRERHDDQDGDRSVSAVMLAARWRFLPEHAWNVYVTGGIGGASVNRHDATDQERNDATQPLAMLGVGVERRFRHFALQAELRAVGMGNKDHGDSAMARDAATGAPPEMATTTTTTTPPAAADEKRGGGSFSIGASYYFCGRLGRRCGRREPSA
jgi:hypothetical protein